MYKPVQVLYNPSPCVVGSVVHCFQFFFAISKYMRFGSHHPPILQSQLGTNQNRF